MCMYILLFKRDTIISFDRFLMQIRKKGRPKIDPCSTTEKNFKKLKDAIYLLYLF